MAASKLEITADYIRSRYAQGAEFRYDVLSRKVQRLDASGRWTNLTDKDINTIACECATATGANITDREVRTVLGSDLVRDIHPLRDWLANLKPYDPRSGEWIDLVSGQVHVVQNASLQNAPAVLPNALTGYETAPCAYDTQALWQTYFKKWFVAMVAGWIYDDVVNHQVLVLIGRQGTGKTTWLEHLMPPELRDYVTKQASVRELSKDDRIRVAEFGLINMDEIDSCSPRELNVLKSLITTADVNERAAYGHTKERRMRVASFCASGNNKQFLSDDTGNRRWLPFEVESIQSPFHTTIPYNLMYAQAVWLIQHGYNYWFDMDEIAQLETHNEIYRQIRNEEELLSVYFEPVDPTEPKAVFMTASEIHAKLKMWGNIEKPMPSNKFGECLRKAGYKKKCLHSGQKGYVVKIHDNLQDIHGRAIRELIEADRADSTF